jgi:anti-sigma factor RsiW
MRGFRALTCAELVELVTHYLDGALSRRERARFERHIATCEACTAYVDQIRLTRDALGTLTAQSIEPEARTALLHAFRDWRAA